jgi:hypothetical protein
MTVEQRVMRYEETAIGLDQYRRTGMQENSEELWRESPIIFIAGRVDGPELETVRGVAECPRFSRVLCARKPALSEAEGWGFSTQRSQRDAGAT